MNDKKTTTLKLTRQTIRNLRVEQGAQVVRQASPALVLAGTAAFMAGCNSLLGC
jgi:hypothetical protein